MSKNEGKLGKITKNCESKINVTGDISVASFVPTYFCIQVWTNLNFKTTSFI